MLRCRVEVGSAVHVHVRRKVPQSDEWMEVAVLVDVEYKEKEPPDCLGTTVASASEAEALTQDKKKLGKIARTLFPKADCDDCQVWLWGRGAVQKLCPGLPSLCVYCIGPCTIPFGLLVYKV